MEKKSIIIGLSLIIFALIITIISLKTSSDPKVMELLEKCEEALEDLKQKTKETFTSEFQQKLSSPQAQPLVYPNNVKIAPGNCKPYSGCFFPAKAANPINLRTGERDNQPGSNLIWCEKSWRDCNAYQNCQNGRCVSKI